MTTLEQLLPGDLLLFETDDSTIDKLICALTNSTVAHSAIYYQPGVLVDAAGSGIGAHGVQEVPSSQTGARLVQVRRFSPTPATFAPVLQAARGYVFEHDGYDWSGLVMCALILLYRKESQPGLVQQILTRIFRKLTVELDTWIHEHVKVKELGPHPMFCSEYVFQCFYDAPLPYHLQIRNGSILRAQGPGTLLNRLAALQAAGGSAVQAPAPAPALEAMDLDGLATALHGALAAAGEAQAPSHELAQAAAGLGDVLRRLKTPATATNPASGLAYLQDHQALFVTPGDLLSACVNVTDAGSLYLLRLDDPYPIA